MYIVTLYKLDIFSCAVLSWMGLLARLFTGEPDTALSSDPAYPAILFPELFGLNRAC